MEVQTSARAASVHPRSKVHSQVDISVESPCFQENQVCSGEITSNNKKNLKKYANNKLVRVLLSSVSVELEQ